MFKICLHLYVIMVWYSAEIGTNYEIQEGKPQKAATKKW